MDAKTPQAVLERVQGACRELAGCSSLSWEWDERFSAALAVTREPQHQEVLALLAARLPQVWDSGSIGEAPELIARLAAAWGGLRPGQRLHALDAAADPLLFAFWWPWGSGNTFSVRVGVAAASAEVEALEPLSALRSSFGL